MPACKSRHHTTLNKSSPTAKSPIAAARSRCRPTVVDQAWTFRRSFQGGRSLNRVQRRQFLIAAGALLATQLAAEAQQAAKVARIGHLSPNLAASPHLRDAFPQGLRDLGYAEA